MFAQLLLAPPGPGELWSCGNGQVPQHIPSQPTAPLLGLPASSVLARLALWLGRTWEQNIQNISSVLWCCLEISLTLQGLAAAVATLNIWLFQPVTGKALSSNWLLCLVS